MWKFASKEQPRSDIQEPGIDICGSFHLKNSLDLTYKIQRIGICGSFHSTNSLDLTYNIKGDRYMWKFPFKT